MPIALVRPRISPRQAYELLGLLALVVVATVGVTETDIWGHIRFGLDTIARHRLPATDPYSFTSEQPWVNHEWLSQVVFALGFLCGGLPLLAVVRAGVAAVLACLLVRSLRNVPWLLRDAALVVVLLTATLALRAVRPQIFSIPLYALTLLGLTADAAWLPAVFLVWANLHGGWLIGIGAVAVRTLCAPSVRRLTVLAACAAATLVNPYGFRLWWSLAEAVNRGWSDVTEWQPVYGRSWHSDLAITWLFLAAATIWLLRRQRSVELWRWIWTACVAVAAFRAGRHMPFFSITAAMLVAGRIAAPKPARPEPQWSGSSLALAAGMTAGLCAAVFVLLQPTVTCLPRIYREIAPEAAAVQFIREADLRGRVVMYFDWGLYAVWQVGDHFEVSIDNRRETVYPAEVVEAHHRFYGGLAPDYPDRLGANFVWVPPDLPAVRQLEQRGWFVIYRGPRSVILSRTYTPTAFGTAPDASPCFPDP